MTDRRCQALTRAGKPCQAAPLRGRDYCAAHDPLAPADTRFGATEQAARAGAQGGAAGRRARVVDVIRERVEQHVDEILAPYFQALTSAVETVAYQGELTVTSVPDLAARIAAAERLLDRAYGRPAQTVQHAGEDGGPVRVELDPGDSEVRRLAHELLQRRAQPDDG